VITKLAIFVVHRRSRLGGLELVAGVAGSNAMRENLAANDSANKENVRQADAYRAVFP
jgi:hypothetical protein